MIWGALIGSAAGYLMNRQRNRTQERAANSAAQTQTQAADRAAQVQADAARYAADVSNQGTMAGISETRRQYDQSRADQLPWLQTGQRQLGVLEGRLPDLTSTFTGADLQNDPGYQFGLNQGLDAVSARARALGISNSGGTMKELLRYGNDYAGTKFQEAWARDQSEKQSIYNMLAGISGTGQVAGNNLASQGANASQSIAGLYAQNATTAGNAAMQAGNAAANGITSGANASAAARIASGNARANNYSNLANMAMQLGMYYG